MGKWTKYSNVIQNKSRWFINSWVEKIGTGRAITKTVHSILWGKELSKNRKIRLFTSLV